MSSHFCCAQQQIQNRHRTWRACQSAVSLLIRPLLRQAGRKLLTVLVYASSWLSSLKQGVRMWLLSRQLLSPYAAMRPLWKAARPSTACESPDAAVPERPTDLVVPAHNSAHLLQACALVCQHRLSLPCVKLCGKICCRAVLCFQVQGERWGVLGCHLGRVGMRLRRNCTSMLCP